MKEWKDEGQWTCICNKNILKYAQILVTSGSGRFMIFDIEGHSNIERIQRRKPHTTEIQYVE